jgi:hypothetical protein
MIATIEMEWQRRLVELLDEAIQIGINLRNDRTGTEPDKVRLTQTLFVLAKLREKALNCHLPAPNGRTTLGIARGVTDFVDDLHGPLTRAAGAIELHYLTIPPANPRFPTLPPLTPFERFADGSTKPPVPDGQPVITIQDRRAFAVGVWRRGDFGGYIDTPVNEADLISGAQTLIATQSPMLFDALVATALTCPAALAEHMVWPEDRV